MPGGCCSTANGPTAPTNRASPAATARPAETSSSASTHSAATRRATRACPSGTLIRRRFPLSLPIFTVTILQQIVSSPHRRTPMRWHSLTSVMLAAWAMGSLAHGAPAAPTVERSRAGNVLFQLPDGWRRKDGADGVTHLAPTSYPAGQWYNLRFLPPKPSATSLQASLREQIKAACEGSDDFREESAVVSQHQPAGYDLRMQTVSVASGEGRTYFMVYVAAAGDVVQPVLVATNSADLYNKYQKVAEKVLTGLRFCSMNRLADGDPPLTDHTVNEVNDFLEWVMQAPFTEAQWATVRKFLVKAWEGNDREEIDGVTEVLKARGELAGFAKEKRELARQ